ncbi:MAG: hypothetical protein AVDCRST_MAG39-2556 [uncultured Sphingomonadaceae bacterium]|uniref:Uncharacterized protein n=1 Tax=uncultured Sphingomonadaceae bacterium TaxID=169976 RepID=A0A6J4TCE4_9SPHN|nr:MAG: hypothetical protein AVDCRST_MAG39-2556 [uncultured Sphingomonadaceae bacterium]
MPLMIDVPVPPDRVEIVQSTECADWVVERAKGSVIGYENGGAYCVRFTNQRTEAAFRAM